jgi:hypothetical protein
MTIIANTVNYIREGNKEVLADYIAEEILCLENDIAVANRQIANRQTRIDALMALDFTDKDKMRELLTGRATPIALINGKQYDISLLISSVP